MCFRRGGGRLVAGKNYRDTFYWIRFFLGAFLRISRSFLASVNIFMGTFACFLFLLLSRCFQFRKVLLSKFCGDLKCIKIWNGEHCDAKNGYKYQILKANCCYRGEQKCHEADKSRAKKDVTSLKHIFCFATRMKPAVIQIPDIIYCFDKNLSKDFRVNIF